MNFRKLLLAACLILFAGIAGVTLYFELGAQKQRPAPLSPEEAVVESDERIAEQYDVIVVGTDPEGITAAVSAARNGLSVLLVDGRGRDRFGGLFTLGWLNSLDMNRPPDDPHGYLNKGLFGEWYEQVEGDSFDVTTAAVIFHRMVRAESNIDVLMRMKTIEPVMDGTTVTGVRLVGEDGTERTVRAFAVIDATQDADIAAAAGAPFTFGREDIGDTRTLMAVTPVFKLLNVTPDVWKKIKDRLNHDEYPGTGANEQSAWGYTEMWNYPSTQPEKLRSRGLNLGRQNDDTALVNAIQVFGVDPFDPASVQEAYDATAKELPVWLAYLKEQFPEFAGVEIGPMAPELYVRETRHLIGEYRLSMIDLLENRDHWDRIAFGSYPVDIQSTSPAPTDRGAVVMAPEQYAIPFRAIVPKEIDGLLVTSRSASYDTLPHGSARVVPVGMATGEAAGAAVRIAKDAGVSFRELSRSEELVRKLQERLTEQGMDLSPIKLKQPDYMKHKAYEGLKTAVSLGIAYGSYNNDFGLDQPSNPQRLVYNLNGVARAHPGAFPGDPAAAIADVENATEAKLSLDQAAYTIVKALGLDDDREQAVAALQSRAWLSEETVGLIKDPENLTNGDVYLMIRDVVSGAAGAVYE